MVATQSIIKLASGETVQLRAGLLTGVGPQGTIGPAGPQGDPGPQGVPGLPGQTNLFASMLSGPVSGTLDVPSGANWVPVPLPNSSRNDLLNTPLNQSAFSFDSGGLYLIIARARFDAIASVTMNRSRALRLVDSTGTVYEQKRSSAVNQSDPTDIELVKFVNDAGSGTLYHFEVNQDDTNGDVNVSDLEVQIVLCGAGPAGAGMHEVAAGTISGTTPLTGFSDGITVSPGGNDQTFPETGGLLTTTNVGGEGQQIYYCTGRLSSQNPSVWVRTWDGTNNAWTPWNQITPAVDGPVAYTPKLYAGTTQLTDATCVGQYTKIGKLVFYELSATVGSQHGAAGQGLQVTLPFAPSVNDPGDTFVVGLGGYVGVANPGWGLARIVPGSANLQLLLPAKNSSGSLAQGPAVAWTTSVPGNIANGVYVKARGHYYVD